MKLFLKFSYRWLNARIIAPYFLPLKLARRSVLKIDSSIHKKNRRVWFHAASVGELEALWPVILLSAQRRDELIITILSGSASGALDRLTKALQTKVLQEDKQVRVLKTGFSPWEGQWLESLVNLKPDLFVTVKYEAWPDLWMSLEELKIPLAIISVMARKSLKIAKWFCQMTSGRLPLLKLLPSLPEDVAKLREIFPDAQIEAVGDPRWDRVFSRMKQGNLRVLELVQRYQKFKKPWGVIGNAWLEDLHCLQAGLNQWSGTLWVVPHQIDKKNIDKLKSFLIQCGLDPVLTSSPSLSLNSLQSDQSVVGCILVDEMGFLSELYSMADWAFVGGGYGEGIHSTIEPAVYGVPIAGGPRGTGKFSEIRELSATGQFTLIEYPHQFTNWLNDQHRLAQRREDWIHKAQEHTGAAQKVLVSLEKS